MEWGYIVLIIVVVYLVLYLIDCVEQFVRRVRNNGRRK